MKLHIKNGFYIVLTTLILLNILLFIKLKFFLPQLTGNVQLLDFDTYYKLVKDILKGINPYTVSYMQTLGPPTVFFYFLPFSLFILSKARFFYTIINILAGFFTCHLLAKNLFKRRLRINGFLFFSLLYFSSFPVRFSIEMGQPNTILSYLITSLIFESDKKYKSVILSILILIKTNYLITFIAFIKKNIIIIFKSLMLILFICLILSPFIKPSFYTYYINNKSQNFTPSLTKNDSLNYYNQSIPARLNTLGFNQASLPIYFTISILVIITILKKQNLLLALISSLILSPTLWQHYFAALIPVYFITLVKSKTLLLRMCSVLLFLLIWIEFPFLHIIKTNFFTAIISSHYLISAIILFFLVQKKRIVAPPASK